MVLNDTVGAQGTCPFVLAPATRLVNRGENSLSARSAR